MNAVLILVSLSRAPSVFQLGMRPTAPVRSTRTRTAYSSISSRISTRSPGSTDTGSRENGGGRNVDVGEVSLG